MTETSAPRPILARIFLSPEERRLRAGWRLIIQSILQFILSFLISLPLQVLVAMIPPLGWVLNEPLFNLLAITASIYLARRWLDRRSFSSLGLKWNTQAGQDVLFGIVLTALMMGLIFLAEWAFGWLEFDGFAWQVMPTWELTRSLFIWGMVFLFVGWYEELLSRGYHLQNLADGINMPAAVLISSSVFAALHIFNPSASWISTLGILAAGLFLAFGYLRTKQLWLPIGLHIGWNFFEGPVFGFPVSGLETIRLLQHRAVGPELLTGGAFGPEAGLILLPALALAAWGIQLYTRSRQNTV
jgi:membrane protease YdiL (CAAX protease family)